MAGVKLALDFETFELGLNENSQILKESFASILEYVSTSEDRRRKARSFFMMFPGRGSRSTSSVKCHHTSYYLALPIIVHQSNHSFLSVNQPIFVKIRELDTSNTSPLISKWIVAIYQ